MHSIDITTNSATSKIAGRISFIQFQIYGLHFFKNYVVVIEVVVVEYSTSALPEEVSYCHEVFQQ